jgi:hypothetical protein|tara:strand:- start:1193 stop:2101 length:909 start_codon:yes stop_codon:yes gene_type:complete
MKENTIFISIASYRDPLCTDTIKSIYDNAKYPHNVFLGICQQNKPGDLHCLHNLDNFPYKSNIRINELSYEYAKGPTYARYICSKLWNNEQYFLQIDSHTKFTKNWDIKCIFAIESLKKYNISQKPVLSHYPRNYNDVHTISDKDKFNVTYIRKFSTITHDVIKFEGAHYVNTNNSFIKTPFVTGCFLFLESSFLNEIPFDPNLDYLYTGEEVLHSLRFFTFGYDVFIPNQNIVFHNYIRKGQPKLWDDVKNYNNLKNTILIKVSNVFKSKNNNDANLILGNYGLGNVKTISDFINTIQSYR